MQLVIRSKPARAAKNPFLRFTCPTLPELPQELNSTRRTVQTRQRTFLPAASPAITRKAKHFTSPSLRPQPPHRAGLGSVHVRRGGRWTPACLLPSAGLPAWVPPAPRRAPAARMCRNLPLASTLSVQGTQTLLEQLTVSAVLCIPGQGDIKQSEIKSCYDKK